MAKKERTTGYARLKYGEAEEIWEEDAPAPEKKEKKKLPPRQRLIRRVVCILLAAVLAVALWMGRDSALFSSIGDWFATRTAGVSPGGGYPSRITGTEVLPTNLLACDGMAVTLSDTALTAQNHTARQVFSRQHSFSYPRMCAAGGRWLVYNLGGTGYRVEGISRTVLTGTADGKIQAAALASGGRFALVTQRSDNASRLTVYMPNGSVQYTYSFYDAYITAVALSPDGSEGMVATVSTNGGALAGTLYRLDFSKEEATASFDLGDNMPLFLHWGDNGCLTAVGDTAAAWGNAADFTFSIEPYGSAALGSYAAAESTVCLTLQGGASPELLVLGKTGPLRVQLEKEAVSCSVYGGTAAVLLGDRVAALDTATGEQLSQVSLARSARAVALSSESTAYVLGISELDFVDLDAKTE